MASRPAARGRPVGLAPRPVAEPRREAFAEADADLAQMPCVPRRSTTLGRARRGSGLRGAHPGADPAVSDASGAVQFPARGTPRSPSHCRFGHACRRNPPAGEARRRPPAGEA